MVVVWAIEAGCSGGDTLVKDGDVAETYDIEMGCF